MLAMLACTLFNEQDNGSNLLSQSSHDLYWENKNVQAKKVYSVPHSIPSYHVQLKPVLTEESHVFDKKWHLLN